MSGEQVMDQGQEYLNSKQYKPGLVVPTVQ